VEQKDAMSEMINHKRAITSTDPPYYDNISYADLSDFFYIWLRRSLKVYYPKLFDTLLSPKDQELVATQYRFNGNQETARQFFENGLRESFRNICSITDANYPTTIFYAFKQSENADESSSYDSSIDL
jgi:putative DNA methylase